MGSFISKLLLVLQDLPRIIEYNILPVNMIYFDTVANDIWKGLAPSPIRALYEIHGSNIRYAAINQ